MTKRYPNGYISATPIIRGGGFTNETQSFLSSYLDVPGSEHQTSIDYILIAGGGGGGAGATTSDGGMGGGGGGGIIQGTYPKIAPSKTLAVTVGSGGSVASSGTNTSVYENTPVEYGSNYYSIQFDGAADGYNAGTNANFAFGTGPFCIEAWIFSKELKNYSTLVTTRPNNSSYADAYHIGWDAAGGISLYVNTTSSPAAAAGTMKLNTWQHFVCCRDGNNITSLFVDGTRVGTATNTANLSRSLLGIGDFPTTHAEGINGYISNLRLVKGSSVYDPTQTSITVPTSPLTAITNTVLLTAQTSSAVDSSPTNATLTMFGTPAPSISNPFIGLTTLTAVGGGYGGSWRSNGGAGGSGGGSGRNGATLLGGSGRGGQGYAGGSSSTSGSTAGNGGGGAGGTGNGDGFSGGGRGGLGITIYPFWDERTDYVCGGGGGGGYGGYYGGPATHGAGFGANQTSAGKNVSPPGDQHTGGGGGGQGGGGGGSIVGVAGAGGSGIAYIRVLINDGTNYYVTPVATGTVRVYRQSSGGNTYLIYMFTGTGTLTL